uniref:Uncharacterized protein n=1 Tax=Plectus sambesii TaxID=2011161 RepID=A0A914VZU7_9BILA
MAVYNGDLRRSSMPLLPTCKFSPKSPPSRLSPKMACLPEDGELGHIPASPRSSGGSTSSPDYSPRPRLFSFPASSSASASQHKASTSRSPWKMDEWRVPRQAERRESAFVGDGRSFAEKAFLSSPDANHFQKLRSFNVTKRGSLVDCGYCYRPTCPQSTAMLQNSQEPETTRAILQANGRGRRATCPEIWLSRTESFAPQVYDCDLWVIGTETVGKRTLIDQLVKETESDELVENISLSNTDDSDSPTNISFLINSYEVQLKIRTASPSEMYQMHEARKGGVFLIVYSISSHQSFTMAADALYQIYEAQKRPGKKARPAFHALLIGNKMDLQRNRKVGPAEGKMLAKIYNCKFLETSSLLSMNIDVLLKEMLAKVQAHLEEDEVKGESATSVADGPAAPTISELTGHQSRSRVIDRIRQRGRRLARSCEELFARLAAL